ncbi:MAG: DUF421 domain-containing protein, partial [Oscillospiraceae bacterium]
TIQYIILNKLIIITYNNIGDIMIIAFYRTIILYIIIILAFKIMGKKQVGELQPSELVVTILISNIAALPIENSQIPMLVGTIPIFVLVSFEVILSYISLKSPFFRKLITGHPLVLIKDGKIQQKTLKKNRFCVEDIMEELRIKDIFNIADVDLAMIETNGKVSIYKKQDKDLPTREDFGLIPKSKKPAYSIIIDGIIMKDNLKICNLTKDWLNKTLEKENLKPNDIFLMTCDISATYNIVKRTL